MVTQRVQIKGFLLLWFVGHVGTRNFCPALAALIGPLYYFNLFVPIAQQATEAVMLGHLSLNMFLWAQPTATFLRMLYSALYF
jgi:hypothetical protein